MFGKLDLRGFLKVGGALGDKPDLISLKVPKLFALVLDKPAFISLKLLKGEALGSGKPGFFSESPGTGPCSVNLPPVQESMKETVTQYSYISNHSRLKLFRRMTQGICPSQLLPNFSVN